MTMEHSVKLNCLNMHIVIIFDLIAHGVVMEGKRKMTGGLQTFGGHFIISSVAIYVNLEMLNSKININ